MVRRILGITGISLWAGLVVAIIVMGFQAKANGEQMFENLPEGWKVEKSFVVSKEQITAISQKLGGRIRKLTNTILSFEGQYLQVNVFHCPTVEQAERIYKAVLKAHNGLPASVAQDGSLVAEFAKSDDVELMNQARLALSLPDARLDPVAGKLIRNIPAGWEIKKSFTVPPDQTIAIGKKLGGQIKDLSNTIFSVEGQRFQVNIIECATPLATEKIHNSILKMKAHPSFCLKLDNTVVEFVSDDVNLAKEAVYELGIKQKPPLEDSQPATMAKDLVNLLVDGDYAEAVKNFDSTMKEALPAEKLQEVWNSIIAQAGPFKEQLGVRKEKILQYDVMFVTCKFERAALDTKVVFNQKQQISGLFFVPSR